MLYPTLTVDLASAQGMLAVAPGSMIAVPFLLTAAQGVAFALSQWSPTQDFSLRAWISQHPGGRCLPGSDAFWHLGRQADRVVLACPLGAKPPILNNCLSLGLAPGSFTLNVLNLSNSENVFLFSSTSVAC